MKKSYLILPLSALVLAACSSDTQAPIVNGDGELTPGVMQPVAGTGSSASSYGWNSSVPSTSMPSSMGSLPMPEPMRTLPTQNSAPIVSAPSVSSVNSSASSAVTSAKSTATQAVQSATSFPHTADGKPDYSQIQRGSYKGSTYKVQKGDTLYFVSYISGRSEQAIAQLNGLKAPYTINAGQTLKFDSSDVADVAAVNVVSAPEITYVAGANGTQIGSDGSVTGPIQAAAATPVASVQTQPAMAVGVPVAGFSAPQTATTYANSAPVAVSAAAVSVQTAYTAAPQTVYSTASQQPTVRVTEVTMPSASFAWIWPTQGQLVDRFSEASSGNKGIDIAGMKGQEIKAASAGRVVYAGNALAGYGNLIIIKHDDDFMSVYAHNDRLYVRSEENVAAGQTIATMGNSDSRTTRLHFEIRHQGKSVDPLIYLPR